MVVMAMAEDESIEPRRLYSQQVDVVIQCLRREAEVHQYTACFAAAL